MRGKAGRFNFAIFLAVVLLLGTLSLTTFLWSIFIDCRVSAPTEKSVP
ncbi:MAG: hypothetical protein GYA78_02695, partial [Caldisericales bacterium]|nr:hypothetical protein [Caldisericales bacterium]